MIMRMNRNTERKEIERSRIEAAALKGEDLTLKPDHLAKHAPRLGFLNVVNGGLDTMLELPHRSSRCGVQIL